MTVGTGQLFNIASTRLLNQTDKWSADSFRLILVDNTNVLSKTFTGGTGLTKASDFTASEITGTGYTANGVATTVAVVGNAASSNATITCTGATWTNISPTKGIVYTVLINTTTGNAEAYCPLDAALTPQTGPTYTSLALTFLSGFATYSN